MKQLRHYHMICGTIILLPICIVKLNNLDFQQVELIVFEPIIWE